ncbi:hypothetical protein N781_13770 [Pontibacillus halophilus JSM 076056 = DSM 19796]|uniref:Uncharacterized protein n=1 Tax=Pontibacillus halophilus JSM 076056 = DSM 19796 TaxID=1385510 RepID=A0A0A5IB52_9BACI|nr:hypothetical protein [Pontibacillus halophilus]KGX93052.1 hypothetical protein N781_13770 [Pontibacillus halophilus JSM 076056 = DSM 19796]
MKHQFTRFVVGFFLVIIVSLVALTPVLIKADVVVPSEKTHQQTVTINLNTEEE